MTYTNQSINQSSTVITGTGSGENFGFGFREKMSKYNLEIFNQGANLWS